MTGLPLVYASEGFLRLSGYALCEVLGRNCRFMQEGTFERSEPELVEEMAQAIRGSSSSVTKLHSFRKNGERFQCLVVLVPVVTEGECCYTLGFQVEMDSGQPFEAAAALEALDSVLQRLPKSTHRDDASRGSKSTCPPPALRTWLALDCAEPASALGSTRPLELLKVLLRCGADAQSQLRVAAADSDSVVCRNVLKFVLELHSVEACAPVAKWRLLRSLLARVKDNTLYNFSTLEIDYGKLDSVDGAAVLKLLREWRDALLPGLARGLVPFALSPSRWPALARCVLARREQLGRRFFSMPDCQALPAELLVLEAEQTCALASAPSAAATTLYSRELVAQRRAGALEDCGAPVALVRADSSIVYSNAAFRRQVLREEEESGEESSSEEEEPQLTPLPFDARLLEAIATQQSCIVSLEAVSGVSGVQGLSSANASRPKAVTRRQEDSEWGCCVLEPIEPGVAGLVLCCADALPANLALALTLAAAWRREAQTVYPTEEEEEKEVTAAASSQPSDSSQAPPELAKARLASPKSFKAKELVLPWRQTTPAAGKREAPVVPRLTVHGARAPSVMPHQLTHNEQVAAWARLSEKARQVQLLLKLGEMASQSARALAGEAAARVTRSHTAPRPRVRSSLVSLDAAPSEDAHCSPRARRVSSPASSSSCADVAAAREELGKLRANRNRGERELDKRQGWDRENQQREVCALLRSVDEQQLAEMQKFVDSFARAARDGVKRFSRTCRCPSAYICTHNRRSLAPAIASADAAAGTGAGVEKEVAALVQQQARFRESLVVKQERARRLMLEKQQEERVGVGRVFAAREKKLRDSLASAEKRARRELDCVNLTGFLATNPRLSFPSFPNAIRASELSLPSRASSRFS